MNPSQVVAADVVAADVRSRMELAARLVRLLTSAATLAATLTFSGALAAAPAESKGHLFIIGGGRQPAEMTKRFIDLAGGTNRARIVVLPMASEDAASSGAHQVAEFKSLGAAQVESVVFTREQATNRLSATRLDGATGIFFTGGDQSRLAAVLVNSPVH